MREMPDWNELYSIVGQIALAMNHNNWLVFEALRLVLNMSREDASSFFYSLKSDSAQRDFAMAIINDRLNASGQSALVSRLKTELNELGRLSGIRNGFIHTSWSADETKFVATHGTVPHPKIDWDDPIKQGKALIRELWEMSHRLIEICDEIELLSSPKK